MAGWPGADDAGSGFGCPQRFPGLPRELHEVPFWHPEKPEALREGQAYVAIDRARDAERTWLEVIKDDPLHPIALDVHHDACQVLLKIYAIEDRWEDAYPIIWKSYDRAEPIDHPVLLGMRLRPEFERVSHKESLAVLERYVAADPLDREALRAGSRRVGLGAACRSSKALSNLPEALAARCACLARQSRHAARARRARFLPRTS